MTLATDRFAWRQHPEAAAWLAASGEQLLEGAPPGRALAQELLARTNTRLCDWLDHLVLADDEALRARLAVLGFQPERAPCPPTDAVYVHSGAAFPRLVLRRTATAAPGAPLALALGVGDLHAFLMAQGVHTPTEGSPLGPYRQAGLWPAGRPTLWAVQRQGYGGFLPSHTPPDAPARLLRARERWATRQRRFADPRQGLEQTIALARAMVRELDADVAAWTVLAGERAYWQGRNRAAQAQGTRQAALGLGWPTTTTTPSAALGRPSPCSSSCSRRWALPCESGSMLGRRLAGARSSWSSRPAA